MTNGETIKIIAEIINIQGQIREGVETGEISPVELLVGMRQLNRHLRKLNVSTPDDPTAVYVDKGELVVEFNGSSINNDRIICREGGKTLQAKCFTSQQKRAGHLK